MDATRSYCQPSNIASYRGSAMSADTIPCRKKILQGTEESGRRRGKLRKSWKDNIKEWTGCSLLSLLRIADDRSR